MTNAYNHVSVLIVGAGPAGLSAAIRIKQQQPDLDVVVIDKSAGPGHHCLSGATMEMAPLNRLMEPLDPNWRQSEAAQKVLTSVDYNDIRFLLGKRLSFPLTWMIRLAKKFRLNFGMMAADGDCVCSISKLTAWLSETAVSLGVEVMYGFAAEDILWDENRQLSPGVKLVDQGRNKDGSEGPTFLPGEIIRANTILIAEGCDGLLMEKFIARAGLTRRSVQNYSIGVKELIKVSDEQYAKFGAGHVVHAMGHPLWTPVIGPGIFGGGILYPMGDNHIAVGMIVGLDYKYYDFNPQDALTRFKEHRWVKPYIEGGTVTEAGAKMIPEGGFFAIPRDASGHIGRSNVVLLGDSAGLVNMIKIKGLHNAIASGIAAGEAAVQRLDQPEAFAEEYTQRLQQDGVLKEMQSAQNFRQTVAKFGNLIGMPLSVLGGWLPQFKVEPDFEVMTTDRYRLKPPVKFDKDTFTAMAGTDHREDQPSHLSILDGDVCMNNCVDKFQAPCITFCPAGVYERIHGQPQPANPSNCLHCKTCQRKCPFDNIRWTVPEPTGGPRYKTM